MRRLCPLLSAALALSSPPARAAPDEIAAALDERVVRGPKFAVERIEELAGRGPATTSSVTSALLRARFEVAQRIENVSKKTEVCREIVREGLSHLSRLTSLPLDNFEALEAQLDSVPKEATGILLTTSVAFASTIPEMSLFAQLPAAGSFRRAVERTVALDGSYFHGAPHRILAQFLSEAPSLFGGDADAALAHALRAVAVAPKFAENLLILADVLEATSGREAPRYRSTLAECAALPIHFAPGAELEHQNARREARRRQLAESE
ncbi:MAG: hypothetical protein HY791_36625 [Deltaproteobacteria bacterium]|nr:hypothetical protein [Deltaproteobacteria bacterium]